MEKTKGHKKLWEVRAVISMGQQFQVSSQPYWALLPHPPTHLGM